MLKEIPTFTMACLVPSTQFTLNIQPSQLLPGSQLLLRGEAAFFIRCRAVSERPFLQDGLVGGSEPTVHFRKRPPTHTHTMNPLETQLPAGFFVLGSGKDGPGCEALLQCPLQESTWLPKSRSGAPLGSLSDLLKGLAPSSRNANQPTRLNLTSCMPPNPSQGTPKNADYASGSSPAARHQLFISHPPSAGN